MEPTTTTYGGGGGDTPPLWPPSTTRYRRRNPPSPFFSNPAFVILPIIFFLLTLFLVPTFFSRKSQIAKPSTTINTTKAGGSVNKIWDLFNLFLVLFAVLCGIFAKKTPNDEDTISSTSGGAASDDVRNVNLMKSGGGVLSSYHWFDCGGDDDNQIRNHHHRFFSDTRIPERSFSMRNGGSVYSDQRHDSLPPPMNGIISNGGDEGFKFLDDFDINRYRALEMNDHDNDNSVSVHHRRRSMGELPVFKPVPVDKFVVPAPTEEPVSAPPPPSDEPVLVAETVPPPLVPPLPVRRPRKMNNRSVSRRVEVHKRARSPPPPATSSPPPASPLPPSPPPEMATVPPLVEEDVKVEKKKKISTIATKEIKIVLASIYNPVKRKKKQKTKNVIEDSLRDDPDLPVDSSPLSMQPTPPPPPLPSVFKLFKKSSKSKKIHSVPPPVPPTRSSLNLQNITSLLPLAQPQPQPQQRASASQRRTYSTATGRPPLPNRSNNGFNNNNVDNESLSTNSGGQSPLLPMPPPPLPPFQISAMKFTAKNDYIRVKAGPSTSSSSPELDSSSKESSASSNVMDGLDVNAQQSSVSCPSPDVDMKAETFIARLRDEWKNDKINSLKGKQKLGRIPGSNSVN